MVLVTRPESDDTTWVPHVFRAARVVVLLVPVLGALSACPDGAVDAGPDGGVAARFSLRAITFNTGTSEAVLGDVTDAGYGPTEATFSDAYYGNGLAYSAVIDDTRRALAELSPDIIGFQEIFYAGDCASIPDEARAGFICEDYTPGDPTVAQVILGEGYQVVCHLGKPDKCLGVKRSFATFRGCDADLCLDFLDGAPIVGCGDGARIGRGLLDLADGGTLTVVNVHGSSGVNSSDIDCRTAQFAQLFEDLGDGSGEPAANGQRNLIVGDFNTDPGRLYDGDASADKILEYVGRDRPFDFISDVGESAAPTYAGFFNIDHVISDVLAGSCFAPGVSPGVPDITDIPFFDHKPIVCDITGP